MQKHLGQKDKRISSYLFAPDLFLRSSSPQNSRILELGTKVTIWKN
jgi:hypothetical protein